MNIKFNKHNVVNKDSKTKARVYYTINNHVSGKPCVTLYGKTVLENLFAVFGSEVKNDSDYMTDYFEDDSIRFFEGHPLYKQAMEGAAKCGYAVKS